MSDDEIDALASGIFDVMLEDMVLGIALEEHKAGMRNRAGVTSGSPGTPSGNAGATGSTNGSGSVLVDCPKCKRHVTPNRYAQHLQTCLGLGSARRAGPRTAANKARTGADSSVSSPVLRSGSVHSEELAPAPPAAKPKPSKKKKAAPATPESTNENNKREGAAPSKTSKAKKQKVTKASNGKPMPFQPSDLEGSATQASVPSPPSKPSSTISRIPSKLQTSQTPISPSGSSATTPTHTPRITSAAVPAPPRVVRGTGPPRPLLGRGPSVPRTAGIEKTHPPPPSRQPSARTEVDGDLDDLVDTASDSSDDS
ncbi:hypothetical protein CTheo_2446 [Ceratobasidium theobromae]|uniref:SAGA-associated factor 11 n=1 Tax=Ceratobasidium theobromae TaxID=1582974 RepID=A0A5N5QR39_9AGAM|nr:hypothetical protein CTheo_2446 [Ceratobasidium theobromae]